MATGLSARYRVVRFGGHRTKKGPAALFLFVKVPRLMAGLILMGMFERGDLVRKGKDRPRRRKDWSIKKPAPPSADEAGSIMSGAGQLGAQSEEGDL